jgi:hypothetical protein
MRSRRRLPELVIQTLRNVRHREQLVVDERDLLGVFARLEPRERGVMPKIEPSPARFSA